MKFVPNGDSSRETAILLVGTAREYGISQRAIKKVSGGFQISDELADIVFSKGDSDTPAKKATKTSGNRAAKKNSKEE